MMTPVPQEQRSTLLKPFLKEGVESVGVLLKNHEDLGIVPIDIFANAMGQWFVADDLPRSKMQEVLERRAALNSIGFDGELLKSKLQTLFDSDPHLASCCKTVWVLTRFLSKHFLSLTYPPLSSEKFEEMFESFESFVYSNSYRVFLLHHVFNLDSEKNEFFIGNTAFTKFRKEDYELAFVNDTIFNLYYTESAGSFFAYTEIFPADNDFSSVLDGYDQAFDVINDSIGIIQFLKDGFIFSDYGFLTYQPIWVNEYFTPLPSRFPRRTPYEEGTSFLRLTSADIDLANQWLRIWSDSRFQERLRQETNLGKLVRLAIEFYASSFFQPDEAQRLLHLTFALETLFSPDGGQELSFRIRLYASHFIGENEVERQEIFETIKKAYSVRSKLVHGFLDVTSYLEDTITTSSANTALASVVRRSILRALVLLFNGKDNLKKSSASGSVHQDLDRAILDPEFGESMRRESDYRIFAESYYPDNPSID